VAQRKKRKRRHHTVPRFHLQGFASAEGILRQIDLRTGEHRPVSIGDASVVKDFYTVVLDDGTRSDVWEERLAEVENHVAPLVRDAITASVWQPTDQERFDLSAWIALQYLRGPDHRRMLGDMRSMMVRMVVGMGGLAYLRYAMAEGMGRPVSLAEAEAVWDDIHRPQGPVIQVSGLDHVSAMHAMLEQATEFIVGRSWHRVRFGRRTLAINDSPVALIPGDDHPQFRGVGLANAGSITVALDRRTLLWLGEPSMLDFDFPASTTLARAHNTSMVFGAERFIYTHPDDADPTVGLSMPRPERQLVGHGEGTVTDFANRDRPLADVLDQIATFDGSPDGIIANYTWPIPGYSPPQFASRMI
jgi:Protein of unknown function (DUF4238)